MLEKNVIEQIIDSFATEGKIYSREAQFQFDIAWELRKNVKDYEVELEWLWENNKWYVDIVLFSRLDTDENRKYIPIELKYKTLDKNITYKVKDQPYHTYNQGACDNGSYDYIRDIYRIETLKSNNSIDYKGEKYTFECGYAIILTNDWHYYDVLPKKGINDKYKQYYWKNFSLAQEKLEGELYWIDPNSEVEKEENPGLHTTKDREQKIKLSGKYNLNWNEYKVNYDSFEPKTKKEPQFKYLVTQIPKDEGE